MTEPNSLHHQIRELVAQDDIKGAIDLLKANLLDMDELNQLVLKSARFEALQKRERSGTLDYNTLELEKNKLRESLLVFADSFQEVKKSPRPSSSSYGPMLAKKTNPMPYIAGGVVLIIAVVAFFTMRGGPKEGSNPTAGTPGTTVTDSSLALANGLAQAGTINNQPVVGAVVEVSNVMDLLKAIQSNTTIKLQAGTYDLDQAALTWAGSDFIKFVDAAKYENGGALLTHVENLKIIGEVGTRIITRNFSDDVLRLDGCKNISFENIFLGHPELNFCIGGVVTIKGCKQVKFSNCVLHGSGIIGINAMQTEQIELDHSTIEVCSVNFLAAEGCSKIYFHDSIFEKTEGEIGFKVSNTPTVRIEKCQIRNNKFQTALFNIESNSIVKLLDSEVTNTSYPVLTAGNPYALYQEGSTTVN